VGEAEIGLADRHELSLAALGLTPGAESVVGIIRRALAAAPLRIHQHRVEREGRALPFVPMSFRAPYEVGAVTALQHQSFDAGLPRPRPELLQLGDRTEVEHG